MDWSEKYCPQGIKKELIWVPEEFQKEYEKLGTGAEHSLLLKEFLEKTRKKLKDEYESSLAAMNDDALLFEGLFLETKKRFTNIKDEAGSLNYFLTNL